jgi:GNAT superfamily N-acetyltransferase
VQRDDGHRFLLVAERDLDPRLRGLIGELLAATLDAGPAYLGRAWRTIEPFVRAVALDRSGAVVGHAAGFRVPSRPAARIHGLGDVAVDPRHRRRGAARRLCALVTDACWRDGADAVVAKTTPLRGVLGDLGFTAVTDFRLYYEERGACVRHPDWMAAFATELPRPLQLLEGDF